MTIQDTGAPFSQEAEEAVIGSVLIDANAFGLVSSFLKDTDFFLFYPETLAVGTYQRHRRSCYTLIIHLNLGSLITMKIQIVSKKNVFHGN